MATTIDELVVKLSLDPTQFNQGTKQGQDLLRKFRQEVKTTADSTEREAGKMTDGFARVTKELLGLGLAIAGANGLKNLVVGTVQAADALNLQSRALGLNEEILNKWVNTARRAGVSAGEAGSGFRSLGVAAGAVLSRQKGANEAAGIQQMMALGIERPDWQNVDHLAQQIVEGFQRHAHDAPTALAAIAGRIPGGDTFLQIAKQFTTVDALTKALAESVTATHEQAEAARRLTEQFTQLQLAIEKAINKLIPEAEPTVTKVLKAGAAAARGDMTGVQQIDEDLGGQARQGKEQISNFLWDAFVRAVIRPERQSKWLSGSNFVGPREEFGPFQTQFDTSNSGRNLPAGSVRDRLPGLSGRTAWDNTHYRGWPRGDSAAPIDNSRTIRIDAVHLTLPPGTRDPQAFADRFTSAVSAIEAQGGPR